MTRIVLIGLSAAVFWAGPAKAERMALQPGNDECFAIVQVDNKLGVYNKVEVLQTVGGPVSVEYETVGGHNANDHDIIRVRKLPPGVSAFPMEMNLPDGDQGEICLILGDYVGA